ncbi:hypothetical protein [Halomonas sp. HG01]|uniref:hypothetical protein n=1 Tax=Halomonas sp. HG01 TaxID=1609967 RepID=UPI000B260E55|nr:hypothetical protein [Halomonas sp. HG01]
MSRHALVVAAGIIAAVGIVCFPGRVARWAVLPLLALLLTACASTPEPLPEPLATPVVCAPGPGMTEDEASPDKPAGEYTQRDVARYVAEVHQWGSRGWTKLARVRQWSRDCVDRAAVRDGGRAE